MKLFQKMSVTATAAMMLFAASGDLPLSTAVSAISSGSCGQDLSWTLDAAGTLTISGEGAMEDYYYEEGYASPWADYSHEIERVVVEDGVTCIGDWAFPSCGSLTEVILSDTVSRIGRYAFDHCSALTEVQIPQGVSGIDVGAFYQCSSLTSVVLPASVTNIALSAFTGCKGLVDFVIFNPSCTIFDASGTISNQYVYQPESGTTEYDHAYTLYGYADSTAQAYAEKYDVAFVAIESVSATGDVNSDGAVDTIDAICALEEYVAVSIMEQGSVLNVPQRFAADMDGDGKISTIDPQEILALYATSLQ